MMGGGFIDGLVEAEFPVSVFLDVLAEGELMADWDGEIAVILDDLGEVEGESVVGFDLLADESSLLEVAVEDFPHVFFGDL